MKYAAFQIEQLAVLVSVPTVSAELEFVDMYHLVYLNTKPTQNYTICLITDLLQKINAT